MPGKKDFISIKRNQHMQKRLMLCNLKELYSNFKIQYPNNKVGFSKFCSLRPKWCVLPGSSGTHSVCVCTYHQNIKLLLSPLNLDYKDLFSFIVCDKNNKDCMVHRCENCPAAEKLREYLYEFFPEDEYNETINFSQWTTTDRANLVNHEESVNDYIDMVCQQLQVLTKHSYIAKCQTNYLKELKENIPDDMILFLGDFAENYSFVIQDEIQGFHWNNLQATLHPVVAYFKNEAELKHQSYCVISDDLKHDVALVYMVQKLVLNDLKEQVQFNSVTYFSDGCAAQYKNKKSFFNLCCHKNDFDLDAKWVFFATSHGKQPCDGIGGTVKRLVSLESMRRPLTGQILSPIDMFDYCKENIKEIKFIYVKKEDTDNLRDVLTERFEDISTIPGTRSFHEFEPISATKISAKYCSEDNDASLIHSFTKSLTPSCNHDHINVCDYVCCKYDSKLWIGMVEDVDKVEMDYKIKFLHPHFPNSSYSWPRHMLGAISKYYFTIVSSININWSNLQYTNR